MGEEDSYDLVGVSAGDTITVRMADTSGSLSPSLTLLDGTGSEIASTFDLTGGTATLTETLSGAGPYTVLASDRQDDSTGSYSLFFQRVSDPCSATPASCGQTIPSALSAAAEYDTYELAGVDQGDRVTVRMSDTSGALSPKVELYDGSGAQIASTFALTGGTATLTETLSGPGPYTVLVSDRQDDSTGAYSLFFQRVSDPCSATPASCGQTIPSALSAAAEYDTYELAGVDQGDRVTVRMSDTSGALSPKVELYDGSGAQIASTFDLTGGTATLTETLTAPGPYTVLASDREDNSTGAYSLFFQCVSDPCSATPASCGQTIPSALSAAAEYDTYELAGVGQGDRVTVRLSDTSGALSPKVELYDGSGAQIASTFDLTGGTATLTETLSGPGPYTALASDRQDDSTGTYSLFFQRVSDPCSATQLSLGQQVLASITPVAEIDTYVLAGVEQNDAFTLCMRGNSPLEPSLELYDGAGTLLGTDFDFAGGTADVTATLSSGGPVTALAADRNHDDTGDYTVALRGANSSCATTDASPPTVASLAPAPGDLVASGSPVLVRWSSGDDVGVTSHAIRLSTDGGATYPDVIINGLSGAAQSYLWAVPGTLHSDRARLLVIARDATGAAGSADTGGDFLIVDDPPTRTISYTYDQLNRLTDVEYSDGSTIEYVYDAVGNRVSMTTTGPVVIHADGFESGDTSGWTASTGSVAVSAAAALTGSFGLRVDVGCPGDGELVVPDGTVGGGVFEGCRSVRADAVRVDPGPVTFRAGRRVRLGDGFSVAQGVAFRVEIAPELVPDAFVRDDSPAAEVRYGASFSLRLDGLALEPGDEIELFAGSSSDGNIWFRLLLEPESGSGDHLLVLEARQDDDSLRTTVGNPVSVATGWHTVELHWRATGPAVDGRFDLVLDDIPRARLTGLDNSVGRIDSVRLGASGAGADSNGFIDLDEFSSQPQL